MHRLFGKPKEKVPPPTLNDASSGISGRMTDIDKKIADLDAELRKYKEQLKKANSAQSAHIKKRAMDTLKRKRMYEAQRDQLAGQQFNIDQTAFAIETVKSTQTTVAAMKDAAKSLKKEQKKINLSEIEDMQDEMEDMLEDVGEISDILSRSYGVPDGVEEEDLEAELAGLEDEWEAETLATGTEEAAPSYLNSMPSQPTAAPNVFTGAQATATAAQPAANAQTYNSLV